MRWSWQIARIAGTGVYVHVTFVFLLAWLGVAAYLNTQDIWAAAGLVALVIVLFGIVLLHEFGHALAARHFGIKTRDITLLPIGGLARLERMPREPKQELLIALAGPAVNVALAVVFYGLAFQVAGFRGAWTSHLTGPSFLGELVWINLVLAGFNLLPAFPMDGGRVLRAFLAMRMNYLKATRIAASVGKALAVVFVVVGFMYNFVLALVGVFVWLGAAQEATITRTRELLRGITVGRAMATEFHSVRPSDPLSRAVGHLLAGFQHEFPVEEDGRLAGMLTRGDLVHALNHLDLSTPVREVMQRDVAAVAPSDLLQDTVEKIQDADRFSIPVVDNGRLVGLLTMENLNEFLLIQSALGTPPDRDPSCSLYHETHPSA